MILDVETAERSVFDRDFDACVIGSGPAGITLARRLAARGLDVALMEGGDLEWSDKSQDVYAGESVGLAYPYLDTERLQVFGGTSGHWNGLCRAFEAADMAPRPQNPLSGWPITRADLDPYAAEVAGDPRPRPELRRRPARAPRPRPRTAFTRSGSCAAPRRGSPRSIAMRSRRRSGSRSASMPTSSICGSTTG